MCIDFVCISPLLIVPNVWIRPPNMRKEADQAKKLLEVPDGDHLTLLNVYNNYAQSESGSLRLPIPLCSSYSLLTVLPIDGYDRGWTYNNYLNSRALQQADNVRAQLQRTMERFDIDLVSTTDEKALYLNVRKALVCGFFMQVAHKEGEKNGYLTVKDNQVRFHSTPLFHSWSD